MRRQPRYEIFTGLVECITHLNFSHFTDSSCAYSDDRQKSGPNDKEKWRSSDNREEDYHETCRWRYHKTRAAVSTTRTRTSSTIKKTSSTRTKTSTTTRPYAIKVFGDSADGGLLSHLRMIPDPASGDLFFSARFKGSVKLPPFTINSTVSTSPDMAIWRMDAATGQVLWVTQVRAWDWWVAMRGGYSGE